MKNTFLTLLSIALLSCNNNIEQEVVDSKEEPKEEPKEVITTGSNRDPLIKPNIVLIYTDDHGYGDLGAHNQRTDIAAVNPTINKLVENGALVTNGYSTAPQCVPSRAGLLAGRHQSKFGVEDNRSDNIQAKFEQQTCIAETLKQRGYVTAQFGKWHLGSVEDIPNNGFDYYYANNKAETNSSGSNNFFANIDVDGNALNANTSMVNQKGEFHVVQCAKAASAVIKKNAEKPLFLYLAFRAPHTPLDPTEELLEEVDQLNVSPTPSDKRRRALAMLLGVDKGVEMIQTALKEANILDNTLIFYISDNGAPYKGSLNKDGSIKQDIPNNTGSNAHSAWDGSYNTPLNGEKGTLLDGGIHVPFVVNWEGQINPSVLTQPLSTLDVAATIEEITGSTINVNQLDGVNILPYVTTGDETNVKGRSIYWRWDDQAAIRNGKWKLIIVGTKDKYLYNLDTDPEEKTNIICAQPMIALDLENQLINWTNKVENPGLVEEENGNYVVAENYFRFYTDGTKDCN